MLLGARPMIKYQVDIDELGCFKIVVIVYIESFVSSVLSECWMEGVKG